MVFLGYACNINNYKHYANKTKQKHYLKPEHKKTISRKSHDGPNHRHHYENKPIQIYWKFYHQQMTVFR